MDESGVAVERKARRAAMLFAGAGALSIANAWLSGVCPADQRVAFTVLGLLDVCAAILVAVLPWQRWSPRLLAAVPLLALALVDVFAIAGGLEPWIYSLFFVVLAVWIGASLPRWTTLKLAPAFALAYLLPLLLAGRSGDAAATVGLVVPLVVLIGELVAHVIGELRSANARLAHASLRDELTGIGNRRQAMAALARIRPGDAVLLLDVDRFKQINDEHGHATGDAVLTALGTLLRRSMRGADTIARLGGEEFVVLLSRAEAGAAAIAERLLADWRATAPLTTISIGVAVREPGEPPQETLARADRALYRAKHAGRDRACVAEGRLFR